MEPVKGGAFAMPCRSIKMRSRRWRR
jgi:hypothetical protein